MLPLQTVRDHGLRLCHSTETQRLLQSVQAYRPLEGRGMGANLPGKTAAQERRLVHRPDTVMRLCAQRRHTQHNTATCPGRGTRGHCRGRHARPCDLSPYNDP